MGVEFNWTLNQEVLFSSVLTGKPSRKESFNEYHWDCCVIGNPCNLCTGQQHRLQKRIGISRSLPGLHLAGSMSHLCPLGWKLEDAEA